MPKITMAIFAPLDARFVISLSRPVLVPKRRMILFAAPPAAQKSRKTPALKATISRYPHTCAIRPFNISSMT